MKYKCPCCGYYTLAGEDYDICPVCFWENDGGLGAETPDEAVGPNKVSLNQARKNYISFGACECEMKKHVRAACSEDNICADISEILVGIKSRPCYNLEEHLNVLCGEYSLSSNPDGFAYVYYPAPYKNYDKLMLKKEYLVAVLLERQSLAFVLDRAYPKFHKDTEYARLTYVRMSSLLEENLTCLYPEQYAGITWIDDDFLSDENIEFDYKAFEKIDAGIKYLNPKHFSLYDFTKYSNTLIQLDFPLTIEWVRKFSSCKEARFLSTDTIRVFCTAGSGKDTVPVQAKTIIDFDGTCLVEEAGNNGAWLMGQPDNHGDIICWGSYSDLKEAIKGL